MSIVLWFYIVNINLRNRSPVVEELKKEWLDTSTSFYSILSVDKHLSYQRWLGHFPKECKQW